MGNKDFLADIILIQSILDPKPYKQTGAVYKQAGMVSDLMSSVVSYFKSSIGDNPDTSKVLNLLAPGVIYTVLRGLGMGKPGMLFGILVSATHFDVSKFIGDIVDKVKPMVGDGKISSSQVSQAVDSTVQEHLGDDNQVISSLELMQYSSMIKLALIEYEYNMFRLTNENIKTAAPKLITSVATNLLGRLVGWIIISLFAAAGFLVVGDIARKILGLDNNLDKTTGTQPQEPETNKSIQTKFKANQDSPLPSSIFMQNNPANIDNMIIQFAKDIYPDLNGKENLIRNTAGFNAIKGQIVWFNSPNTGSSRIFIPNIFTSKKQLVNYFIDDVAKNA